jgi:hypothetical protein
LKKLCISGILAVFIILSFGRVSNVVGASAPKSVSTGVIQPAIASPFDIRSFVIAQSLARGLNPALTTCIVSHESQWRPEKTGDDGQSRGLFQISRIYHPEVSDAVAFSAVSSTIWALNWIASGHIRQWSTYKLYCTGFPVFLK